MRRAPDVQILPPLHPRYPEALKLALEPAKLPSLHLLGDSLLLDRPLLALFCARQCPARLIVKAQDWARSVRDQEVAIIGGFHTPVEKECFRVLLKGKCNMILCPARGLPKRTPSEWREPIASGRLLVLSFFGQERVRPTAAMALERNRLAAALAERLLVLHAPFPSRTLDLARESVRLDKPVLTLEDPCNATLLTLGARIYDFLHLLEDR